MELPRLEPLWKKYRDRGLEIVAIEATRAREGALKFIKENNLTFHFVEDVEGEGNVAKDRYNVFGYPTSFLIDRTGRVMFYHLGFTAGDEIKLEQEIKELLESPID